MDHDFEFIKTILIRSSTHNNYDRYPVKNRLLFLDLIPFAETRNYVTLIGRNYYWYSKIYSEQLKSANGIAQTNEAVFRALKSQ